MKLSATLKSGVIFCSDGLAEVSELVLFSELHENNPEIKSDIVNDLIVLKVSFLPMAWWFKESGQR